MKASWLGVGMGAVATRRVGEAAGLAHCPSSRGLGIPGTLLTLDLNCVLLYQEE